MVSRLNTASFEFISYQYDYMVQGNSVIKPLQGKGGINGNVSVIRPVLSSRRGVVLSQGLYPSYSEIDPYRMAACSIDTAVRNAIACGATLDHLALLDNFCWCDSNNPERLWQLRQAAQACYDLAVAYGTPYISGKDSMFNDFRGFDEKLNPVNISVPPTLLISSIGVVEDINYCQTMDFKAEGDLIYLAGITSAETGGSEFLACMGEKLRGKAFHGMQVPDVRTDEFIRLYRAVEKALREGLVASSLSVERGGLGLALARSSMSGLLGFNAELSQVKRKNCERNDYLLFSESQGRILLSVNPSDKEAFEKIFAGTALSCIGQVRGDGHIAVKGLSGSMIIDTDVGSVTRSHRSTFSGF